MARKTNIHRIIQNIKPIWALVSRATKAALSYVGHVVRAGGMEDDVMLGRMNGAGMRERPRQPQCKAYYLNSLEYVGNMRRKRTTNCARYTIPHFIYRRLSS